MIDKAKASEDAREVMLSYDGERVVFNTDLCDDVPTCPTCNGYLDRMSYQVGNVCVSCQHMPPEDEEEE